MFKTARIPGVLNICDLVFLICLEFRSLGFRVYVTFFIVRNISYNIVTHVFVQDALCCNFTVDLYHIFTLIESFK